MKLILGILVFLLLFFIADRVGFIDFMGSTLGVIVAIIFLLLIMAPFILIIFVGLLFGVPFMLIFSGILALIDKMKRK